MSTFKFIAPLLVLGAVFVAGFFAAFSRIPDKVHPAVPPISRIKSMSELATLRVQITDSVTAENKHWEARWLLHGEAVLGVDLSLARYVSVDEQGRKAILSLPAPQVIASKVDHHRSAEMGVKQKTWIPLPGLNILRDEVWKHADEKVARLAHHEGYREATKLQTERVLIKLFQDLGWSVSVDWQPTGSQQIASNHIEL